MRTPLLALVALAFSNSVLLGSIGSTAAPTPLTDWRDCRASPFAARAAVSVESGFDLAWLDYGLPRQRGFQANAAAADMGRGRTLPLSEVAAWTEPIQLALAPAREGLPVAVWIEDANDPPTGHAIRLSSSLGPVLLGELEELAPSESRSFVEPLDDGRSLIWFDQYGEAYLLAPDDSVTAIDLGFVGRLLQLAVDPKDGSLLASWVEDLPTSPPSFRVKLERRALSGTLLDQVDVGAFPGAPSELRLAVPRHGGPLMVWNEGSGVVIREIGGTGPLQRFAAVGGGLVEHLSLVHDDEGNALVSWLQGGRLVLQRRSADGVLTGPELIEPTAEEGSFQPPQPVALPAGRAVVVANEDIPFIFGAPPPCGGDSSGLYSLPTSLAASTDLLLMRGRFRIQVDWQAPGVGASGRAQAVIGTEQSGSFTFFEDTNKEIEIKILDGRPINGSYWVFAAGLSDVAYQIRVKDQRTGAVQEYENPAGSNGNFIDTFAFPGSE